MRCNIVLGCMSSPCLFLTLNLTAIPWARKQLYSIDHPIMHWIELKKLQFGGFWNHNGMNVLNAGSLGLKFHTRRSPSSHHVRISLRPGRQFLSLLQKFPTAKCLLRSIPRLPTLQFLKTCSTQALFETLYFSLFHLYLPPNSLSTFRSISQLRKLDPIPAGFKARPRGTMALPM